MVGTIGRLGILGSAVSLSAWLSASAAAAAPREADAVAFADDFGEAAQKWESTGGTWAVVDGRYQVRNESEDVNVFAYPRRAPLLDVQSIQVRVTPTARLGQKGWSFAGVCLFLDPANFWLLALTEDAQAQRYVDFLENHQGVWQAQGTGATMLTPVGTPELRVPWEYGTTYRLRLDLAGTGVQATVSDGGSGKPVASGQYEFGTAEAVRSGLVTLVARGAAAAFDDVRVTAPASESDAALEIAVETGARGAVAMLRDTLPGLDLATVDHLAAALRQAGFGVTFLSAAQACSPALLSPHRFLLYVIPNAEVYPAAGGRALAAFTRRQGHLLLLGGPAFTRPVWLHDGQWLDREAIRSGLARAPTARTFLDFSQVRDASDWTRATNDGKIAASAEIEADGPAGVAKCLKVSMADLTGWTTFRSPVIEGMFAPGHELLCFWARGDANTSQLSVEINETDESRWIAVVPLKTEWTYQVLAAEDFDYWPDSRTARPRGGAGDRLHPAAACRVVVGLAHSHTHAVGAGPHTIRIAKLGSAPNPYAGLGLSSAGSSAPLLETVSPSYKVYPVQDMASAVVSPVQRLLDPDLVLAAPAKAVSAIARPMGKGFGNQRKWRWVPLVEARDSAGERRGTIAWLLLNHTLPYRDSGFAVFGVRDQALLRDPAWTGAVVRTVGRLADGVFLAEAGARHFSLWPGERLDLGAAVVNLAAAAATVRVRLTVTANGQVAFRDERTLEVPPGETLASTRTWDRPAGEGEVYRVRTELLRDGAPIDVIEHEVGVLSTRERSPDEFVTVRDGDFWLQGRKWYPVGVNYWALYVSGSEPEDYGLGWFAPGFYDPDEVERDLVLMERLGLNLVSIQLGRADEVRCLLDFFRRCDRHGIKVNGFLSGASPIAFDEKAVAGFLSAARLSRNPTLFAYDTIWEPGNWMFGADRRPAWDADWEAWLVERYGSVASAEADWGLPAPRRDGKVVSPSDQQLREDGSWRVMVAAYRRFMDDLMSRKWNDATRRLRQLDPNHLVSFRQGNTLPHDFAFTAPVKHIDFICPEGYSIWPGEDGYNAIGFTNRYVTWTTGGKPIYWSEFGRSCWDSRLMQPDQTGIRLQAEYQDLFYRGVLDAGGHGTAPWWWPGGYRTNEKSDYGIINPDGTPRPSAELVARYAARLKAPRPALQPDTWFTVDRDAHAGGYWYVVFNTGRAAYAAARQQGQVLGVRGPGTNTNSCDTPLLAVGNTPYTGRNPPKYLNAEFNWLRVRDHQGQWVEVQHDTEVRVSKAGPVLAQASVGNTQEAEWLTVANAKGRPGAVFLASTPGSGLSVRQAIPRNTPRLADAEWAEFELAPELGAPARVELQMTADARAWFGEKRRFSLVPVP